MQSLGDCATNCALLFAAGASREGKPLATVGSCIGYCRQLALCRKTHFGTAVDFIFVLGHVVFAFLHCTKYGIKSPFFVQGTLHWLGTTWLVTLATHQNNDAGSTSVQAVLVGSVSLSCAPESMQRLPRWARRNKVSSKPRINSRFQEPCSALGGSD